MVSSEVFCNKFWENEPMNGYNKTQLPYGCLIHARSQFIRSMHSILRHCNICSFLSYLHIFMAWISLKDYFLNLINCPHFCVNIALNTHKRVTDSVSRYYWPLSSQHLHTLQILNELCNRNFLLM